MKTHLFTLFILLFTVVSLFAFGTKEDSNRQNQVVVYTYDSFLSEWGAAPQLETLFEQQTGYDVVFIDGGDGGQLLARGLLEKDDPQADVIVGIDNNQLNAARSSQIFEAYQPKDAEKNIPQELILDKDWLLVPYDWSHFSLIYNSFSGVPCPTSLEDLTSEVYKNKIILMDPRTSTPGLGFVAWTVAVFGQDYLEFWKKLKPNILTMAPSWSTGYGLFTSGEAPLVISYTTSPAYHVEYDEGEDFKTVIFDQGHVMQIEGMGLLKNSPNQQGGKAFIDFMVSLQAQEILPLTQWMYPVNSQVKLPESYRVAKKATKTLKVDNETLNVAVDAVMELLAY